MLRYVFILCLLCSSAVAGDRLELGERMFGRMQYDEAIKQAERILGSSRARVEDLVRAYRLLGLCQAALNQRSDAVKSFRRLLSISPGFRLEKGLSPKYTAPFYQAVALSEETGYLTLVNLSPLYRVSSEEPRLKLELKSDPLGMVSSVRLSFWTGERQPLQLLRKVKGPGVIDIPLQFTRRAPEIRYFFEALNSHGGAVARLGNRKKPFRLGVRTGPEISVSVAPVPAPAPATELSIPEAAEADSDDSWYASWWFWTIVGVVAAGTATGVTLAVLADSGDGSDFQVTWEHR